MKIRGWLLLCCAAGGCDPLKRGSAFAGPAPRVRTACGIIEAESNAFFTKSRLVGRLLASDVARLVRSDLFMAVAPVISLIGWLRVRR